MIRHDGIWILEKCYHDVAAAFTGGNGEIPGLVGRDFAGELDGL